MSQAVISLNPVHLSSRTRDILHILGASLFIAICAQIRIPLFFTPVPITLQTLAALLVGSVLGSKKGILAALAYIAEGLFGLPVFAGGACSLACLFGPTGGYIVGYPIQAALAGLYFERVSHRSRGKTLAAMITICALQMGVGCLWLAPYVGWQNVFLMGFLPFIPGEILKSMVVTAYCKDR